MYINLSKPGCAPTWRCKRGSSKLEGYHSNLNGILQSGNTSPEVAKARICLFNLRWNVLADIKNAGGTDYGSRDLLQLRRIRESSARCGVGNLYPDLRDVPEKADFAQVLQLGNIPEVVQATCTGPSSAGVLQTETLILKIRKNCMVLYESFISRNLPYAELQYLTVLEAQLYCQYPTNCQPQRYYDAL